MGRKRREETSPKNAVVPSGKVSKNSCDNRTKILSMLSKQRKRFRPESEDKISLSKKGKVPKKRIQRDQLKRLRKGNSKSTESAAAIIRPTAPSFLQVATLNPRKRAEQEQRKTDLEVLVKALMKHPPDKTDHVQKKLSKASPVTSLSNFASPFQRKGFFSRVIKKRNKSAPISRGGVNKSAVESGDATKEPGAEDHSEFLDRKRRQGVSSNPVEIEKPPRAHGKSLHTASLERLREARFRHLNEQLYSTTGAEAMRLFAGLDGEMSYRAYHEGFQQQVSKWPQNPLDRIIKQLKKMNPSLRVADLGAGEGRLALEIPQEVHSFDLFSLAPHVTRCDMARTPLCNGAVDVGVCCLSLMGTNVTDYLQEANRILKPGGLLKVAEVRSRFGASFDSFIRTMRVSFHFQLIRKAFDSGKKEEENSYFIFLDFKKTNEINMTKKQRGSALPEVHLQPCLYKRR